MKQVRAAVSTLATALSSSGELDADARRLAESRLALGEAGAALDGFLAASTAQAAARRRLAAALANAYPQAFPLHASLRRLEATPALGEAAAASRAEAARSVLASPLLGLSKMCEGVLEAVAARDRAAAERAHYVAKVGKLLAG